MAREINLGLYAKKGSIPWNKGKKGVQTGPNKGKKFSIEHRNKISKTRKARGIKPPSTLGKRWKQTKEARKKRMGKFRGENSWNWKGGLTSKNMVIRNSSEYKLWRTAVFERDNYICVWCKQVGGKLNADHIKPFADYPELRFAIDNGRTLCLECHKTTEHFGWKYYHYKKLLVIK